MLCCVVLCCVVLYECPYLDADSYADANADANADVDLVIEHRKRKCSSLFRTKTEDWKFGLNVWNWMFGTGCSGLEKRGLEA